MIKIVSGTPAELDAAVQREVARLAAEEDQMRAQAMQHRLVFLDFDGVLNHGEFFSKRVEGKGADDFDRACVARLNRLLHEMDALVVVSSSWRIGRTLVELRKILKTHGFEGRVISKTPDRHEAPIGSRLSLAEARGDEIRAWLDALPAPHRRFVVLDDDSDMDAVRPHFVKTLFHEGGFTEKKLEEGLELFRRLDR